MNGTDMSNLLGREQHLVRARSHWANIRNLGGMMMQEIIAFGKELNELKDKTPHGEWETTLRNEFGFGRMQATKYIAIAENPPELANVNCNLHLGIDTVYKLLAAPEVDQALAARAEAGEEITAKDVRAELGKLVQDHKSAAGRAKKAKQDAQQRAELLESLHDAAQTEVAELRARIAELQAQAQPGAKPKVIETRVADPAVLREITELKARLVDEVKKRKEAEHRAQLNSARLNDTAPALIDKTRRLQELEAPRDALQRIGRVEAEEFLRRLRGADLIAERNPSAVGDDLLSPLREIVSIAQRIIDRADGGVVQG